MKWQSRDIVRAHRIAAHWSGKPRPMIAKFHHWDDKLLALGAREELRKVHIGIGNDLTKRQRKTLAMHKRDGKTAYYKNGKLVVTEGRATSSTQLVGTETDVTKNQQQIEQQTRTKQKPRTRLQSRINLQDSLTSE